MLNHLHEKICQNHSIISCFDADVHRKVQFFLSHKVSLTFLNNKTMNDEFDDTKTSVGSFYVPWWALTHHSIEFVTWKEMQHPVHTILVPNWAFLKYGRNHQYQLLRYYLCYILSTKHEYDFMQWIQYVLISKQKKTKREMKRISKYKKWKAEWENEYKTQWTYIGYCRL